MLPLACLVMVVVGLVRVRVRGGHKRLFGVRRGMCWVRNVVEMPMFATFGLFDLENFLTELIVVFLEFSHVIQFSENLVFCRLRISVFIDNVQKLTVQITPDRAIAL